jgi:hypothetical protein
VESTEISVSSRWSEWNSTCSTWIPPGFHVEMDNNLAGLPAKQFHLESRWNSYFHVDSMWNHLESMGEGKVLSQRPRLDRTLTGQDQKI